MKNLIKKLMILINNNHKINPDLSLEELLQTEKKYKKEYKIAKYIHLSGSPLYLIVT